MKRTAGELGLAPKECICDPMDLAALGHMTNCPAHKAHDWCVVFPSGAVHGPFTELDATNYVTKQYPGSGAVARKITTPEAKLASSPEQVQYEADRRAWREDHPIIKPVS